MTLGSIRTFLDSLQGLSFIEIHWIFKDIATRFMLHKQQWINFGLHWDLLQHFWILSKVSQRYIGFSRILQRGSCFINSNSGLQELLPVSFGLVATFLDSIQGFIEIHWIFKDIATRFMLHKQQWINFGLHWDLLQHFWILSKVSQRFIGFSRILQQGSCFINSSGLTLGYIGTCCNISGFYPRFHRDTLDFQGYCNEVHAS